MRNESNPEKTATDGGIELLSQFTEEDGNLSTEQLRKNGQVTSSCEEKHEFLIEAIRRKPLLTELRCGPSSATELSESVNASRSTIHRATNTLEAHHLIEKESGKYALTSLGEIVADKVDSFGTDVWTAMTLEPFLNTINVDGIPIEHFTDATITRPKPRQPHTSIQRIIELIEESSTLRMLSTVLSPIYVDVGHREMMDGMTIEAVFDHEAIEIMVTQYAEEARESIQSGNFDVYAHNGLPFELFILDDRIGMAAHDVDGIAKILVECESAEAIEWAIRLYQEYRAEADPLLVSNI